MGKIPVLAHVWDVGKCSARNPADATFITPTKPLASLAHCMGVNGVVLDVKRRLAATASDAAPLQFLSPYSGGES